MFCMPSPSAVLETEPRKLCWRPVGSIVLPFSFLVLLLCEHVCVYVEARDRCLASSSVALLLILWRHGLSRNLELSHLSRLTDLPPSGALWVLPSQHCQQGHVLHLLFPPHLLCGFVEKGLPFMHLLSVLTFSYKEIVCVQILVGLLLGKQCKTLSA